MSHAPFKALTNGDYLKLAEIVVAPLISAMHLSAAPSTGVQPDQPVNTAPVDGTAVSSICTPLKKLPE